MQDSKNIIPTKENPIFTAECDYFGYIEGPYKDSLVSYIDSDGSECGSSMPTFGVNFKSAVDDLHEWLIESKHIIEEFPKAKFNIYLVDGSIDKKLDQAKFKKVYTISATKAKQLLF